MDRGEGVRRRHRHHEPPPRPGLDAAGHLLRLAPEGAVGAVLGGLCFIIPGLVLILALSAVFLAGNPPIWVLGAAAGAGAVVPAVALNASWRLVPAS